MRDHHPRPSLDRPVVFMRISLKEYATASFMVLLYEVCCGFNRPASVDEYRGRGSHDYLERSSVIYLFDTQG